jgi:phthalate 4,5-dioxygenase oxygenase subunit
MLEAVREFQRGEPAIGTGDKAIPASVCAFQAVVPKTIDWREYAATCVWGEDPNRPALEPSYSVKA